MNEHNFLLSDGNDEDRADDELLDFNGMGLLSKSELAKWESARRRFGDTQINLTATPRSENTLQFISGVPSINNPLGLIRPFRFHSVKSFLEANGSYDHLNYKEEGDNKWEINIKESNYLSLVKRFEEVAVAVIESLDILEIDKMKAHVQEALQRVFGTDGKGLKEVSSVESPESWLFYSVMSVFNNSSVEISPSGRLRSLELLKMYSARDFALALRKDNKNYGLTTGYERASTPRLPYTFCSKEDRLQKSHAETWKMNEKIKELTTISAGQVIDWREVSTKMTTKYPEEAVQIALLFLNDISLVEGGVAFLQSIPKLDQRTLSRMFGKRATFIIEHRIAEGQDIETIIAQGMGVIRKVDSVDVESTDPEELIQQLRREKLRREDAEDRMVIAQMEVARLRWQKSMKDERERELLQELQAWRNGSIPKRGNGHADILLNEMDPKGYYRALGLYPNFFEGLTDTQVEELLRSHYRYLAVKNTKDPKSGGTEEMYLLNEAYQFLSEAENRKMYGR